METTTHQQGSLVTIKSLAGKVWTARYVRTQADGLVICETTDGRFHIDPSRIVSIGETHHASW